ncbi:MAG: 1-acyl-sn-glycerol-3-phosphate acyltransferase [Anaerolineales bacterium]|nr:1-acyl-sn-glycerol-3-phosphate acyltransferase [Anaerolineales bacterium]
MDFMPFLVNSAIKQVIRILCLVDDSQLSRIPDQGPLILVVNHINFLDVPLIYTHLLPRPVTGLAKTETWDNPALRPLFNMWGAIPIQRGEADVNAMRLSLEALQANKILAIAPEGTRSRTGHLQRGKSGVVMLALKSGAPLLPVAIYGGEAFSQNVMKLQRTNFNIIVGYPFRIDTRGVKVTKEIRQEITDEIMYQLAILLPSSYRGYYSNIDKVTDFYLRYISLSMDNIHSTNSIQPENSLSDSNVGLV